MRPTLYTCVTGLTSVLFVFISYGIRFTDIILCVDNTNAYCSGKNDDIFIFLMEPTVQCYVI